MTPARGRSAAARAEAGPRPLGHRLLHRRRRHRPALDFTRRPRRGAVGAALGAGLAGVLRAPGRSPSRSWRRSIRAGRHLRVGPPRLRAVRQRALRLVPLGQQPVLLPVAAALRGGQRRGDVRRPDARARRQPPLLDHLRPRLPVVHGRHQHPGLRGRALAAERRRHRDVGAGGAAHRRRRGRRRIARIGDELAPSAMVPRATRSARSACGPASASPSPASRSAPSPARRSTIRSGPCPRHRHLRPDRHADLHRRHRRGPDHRAVRRPAERSGIADAVDVAATRMGLPAVGPLTAFLLAASGMPAAPRGWPAAPASPTRGARGQWPARSAPCTALSHAARRADPQGASRR